MNLSIAPNTPIRTPQSRSSNQTLQLTPIWEEVIKNNRLPPDINNTLIFKEISIRLEDLEWPVRQHALRVLSDIIPIISKERLDEQITQNHIFDQLIWNLGHPAPGIRKVASETIQRYLKRTTQTEKMLEEFVRIGLKEETVRKDETGILRENVTLGTVVNLVEILKPFIVPENGEYSISQSLLSDITEALADKTNNLLYRQKCLETLSKIKDVIGETRFNRTLQLHDSPLTEAPSIPENDSDGTDTETYTKEPAPILDDDTLYYHVNHAEASHYTPPSFVPIDDLHPKVESRSSSPRVVLEAEIQFAKNQAITMKVMEDDHEGKIEEDERRLAGEEEEEKTRTPRRVRFGGEVIKLRTPDSDTTDITIEIHEPRDGGGREPTITITPDPVVEEVDASFPAVKPPSREPSPCRAVVSKEGCVSSRNDSFDSAPSSSSSGSEGEAGEKWSDDGGNAWKWVDMRLVEENIVKDLQNKDNWKIQYQALEQLKIILINPKTIERIVKVKNPEKLNSLFKCLLHELPQSTNQQVTTLSLSIITQMIETLPKELISGNVEDIVQGLCRYVGGCKNLNLKIEAIQSLKALFGIVEPSTVIDVLLGDCCLSSPCSKLRENSLLAITYAMMTFPSDMFDVEKILEKVSSSVADVRRRVRHGSLEAIAVLSQFSSSQTLTDSIARVAEGLSTPVARAQLIAAVQARLSRRLLPTISNEGLVLYALQIPASRRFGNLGNPMGADVDWILSGTGSLSTGSARSKTQLNAAQRLQPKPTAPLSPNKWSPSERGSPRPSLPPPTDNPWKIQKQRTESSSSSSSTNSRFYKTQSTGNLHEKDNFPEKRLRPEDITWALVPISALEDPLLGRERSNSLWGDSLSETPQYLSTFGPLRPMYLKLQPTNDHHILSRSTDDVRRNSFSFNEKKDLEDFTEIRLLTPTALREKNYTDNSYQNGKSHSRGPGETPTRIPVLCSNNTKGRFNHHHHGNERKNSDPEEVGPLNQKPKRLTNGFSGSSTFLPNIHRHDGNNLQKSPSCNKFSDVDEMKLQDTMTQLSGLLNVSKGGGKSSYSVKNQSEPEINGNDNEPEVFDNKIQSKLFERNHPKNIPTTVASAPPVISTETRDQIPSTSSSNSTDTGILSGSELRLRRLTTGSGGLDNNSNGLSYRNYSTYNPKLKGKKLSISKNSNKVGINGSQFPDNLKPFERPKEGLDTCFNQLESQQWEVNMLGLTSLVRLLRHHPAIVLSQLHPIIVALGRQIKNLRSQVARVACQASAEMFVALKRNVEPDLEELSGPLFHRSADTNRFIRADCSNALDKMVDNVGPGKAVTVIISKGTSHQNATVRTVAARLLLRLSEKAGAEKLLSLPKETRDRMLQAGANLLMEGKLETRAFAKQVFRVWSSHPLFSDLILEAVQPNVMRHISKTLVSLKT